MDLVINLDKPKGITSQTATSKVKKIIRAKKAGHTGTLDPSATGVLLVCINRATRLATYFSDLNKEYRAVIKLGEATDTQDAEGNVIEKIDRKEFSDIEIKAILRSFEGNILQKPPMFSAIKHRGKPLYKYAHQGIEIPRKNRPVHVHSIELIKNDAPFVHIRVVCSKGTYIRTLCDDIGRKLGSCAHLYELERTAISTFSIRDSLSIEKLADTVHPVISNNHIQPSDGPNQERNNFSLEPSQGIYTMDSALSWLPEFTINESQVKPVLHGNPIKITYSPDALARGFQDTPGIRIKSPGGGLLAVAKPASAGNILKMDVVFGN
jgi:tRNA pseudouridine55 synthase